MLSYTGRRNLFGNLTNTSDSTTLTLADTLMNASEKRILTKRQWPFLEKKDTTLTTTASTQFKELPQKVSKVKAVTVTVGTTIYTPQEIFSEEEWNRLNQSVATSDTPEFWFIRAGQIGFYPIPATSSNVITLYYRQVPRDLSIADVTSSTVTSITNGATAMVISAGGTASMAGRFIRITETNAAGGGDGYWYEIASATATTITLLKPYAGTTLSAATAACVIGQMSLLPEGYQELPVYDAVKTYYASIQPDAMKHKLYESMTKEMMDQLEMDFGGKSGNVVLDYGDDYPTQNPNLYTSSVG